MLLTDQSASSSRKKIYRLIVIVVIIIFISIITTLVASGQYDGLSLILVRPSEGETYYAGPPTLLYRVPINGWVFSDDFDPPEIAVELLIYRGNTLVDTLFTKPQADGGFVFYVTVNPDGSDGQFPADNQTCGDVCHLPGDIDFLPGHVFLKISAIDPDGNRVTEERNVVVDLSGMINVPVEVTLTDDPSVPVEGVRVFAATWLYLWRSRFSHGETDPSGIAYVPIEVLNQSPTQYVFKVEPTVVDGVLYKSEEFVEVVLPPGATSASQITLRVTRHEGHLGGRLNPSELASVASIPIWAMRISDGEVFDTVTSDEGEFSFTGMALGEYHLFVDNNTFFEHEIHYPDQRVELLADEVTHVELLFNTIQGRRVNGMVTDETGVLLPFAWVSTTNIEHSAEADPHTGSFVVENLQTDEMRLFVRAPGYYSQTTVVDMDSASLESVDFALKRHVDTTSIPWGDGEIIIPTETQYRDTGQKLIVERGWIWGWGGETHPTVIQVGNFDILISEGAFAIEYLPKDRALMYVISGQADIRVPNKLEPIRVSSNQLANLDIIDELKPIDIHPFVLKSYRSGSESPLPFNWEPTWGAIIRDRLSQIGMRAVQIVTLITYLLVSLSLVVIPLYALYWGVIRKNKDRSRN